MKKIEEIIYAHKLSPMFSSKSAMKQVRLDIYNKFNEGTMCILSYMCSFKCIIEHETEIFRRHALGCVMLHEIAEKL